MKTIFSSNKCLICLATLLILAVSVSLMAFSSEIAYADDNVEIVFPSDGYFQSEAPTLIAANEKYLLVYDALQNRLYVRSNTQLNNYDYVLNFSDATQLFAVDDKAFFVADDNYYALDLTDIAATPQAVVLATPEDISYLSTDGTYLYAKSDFGYVTIYGDDFSPALGHDNVRNLLFTGGSVLVGNVETLYVFSTNYGFSKLNIIDLSTDDKQEFSIIAGVQNACLGDSIIYALIGGEIVCLSKTNGEMILSTGIQPSAFAAAGDTLFTIEDTAVNMYALSQNLTKMELVASLQMVGNDAKHFDHPVDIEKLPSKFAVADANNNRIAYFDTSSQLLTTFELDASPKHLTHDGNLLYVACDEQILKLNSLYIEQRYDFEGAIDILYLDKLYVLKDDGVYVLVSGNFEKFFDIDGAKHLSCAEDGVNLFIALDNEIVMIDNAGNQLPTALNGDFDDMVDFAVDYIGNIVIAFDDHVKVYANNITSLAPIATVALESNSRTTLTSCKLVGNELYFTASESLVCKIELDVVTKDNFDPPAISDDVYLEDYYFARPLFDTYYLPTTLRKESLSVLNDALLIVYEYENAAGDYLLAYDGNKLVYVPITDVEEVETVALSGDYVATKATTLYVTPNRTADWDVTLEEGDRVTFLRTTADFGDGTWVVVEYDSKTYFANAGDFTAYVAPVEEKDAVYGRAKGSRVGGIVNVYTLPDDSSEVALEVADGAKVEILETLDDFYKVNIDGFVGYMRKDDVQLSGLTTVQIISIVLAILVLLAGSTVFAAIYMTKRKQSNE